MRNNGRQRKTRHIMKKSLKQRGKLVIRDFLQTFENGAKVVLKATSSYHKGMYFRRFHGKAGTVQGNQGRCCIVRIKDGKKSKDLIIHPVHLKRLV